ncbi:hypothetical protein KKC52_11720 [bacterium]|nr:hypothetical protein [bacterium]
MPALLGEAGLREGHSILCGVTGFVVSLIITVIVAIGLFAGSEAIKVVIDIEENTRRTALSVSEGSE